MTRHLPLVVLLALPGLALGWLADPPAKVEPFALPDPRAGKTVDLKDLAGRKAVVVAFVGIECPLNGQFLPVLAGLHAEYDKQGVAFLGINSNAHDTPDKVALHAARNEVPFPILKDAGNKVADRLGAERTPEVFVLDPKGTVVYRGRIDDQFGFGFARPGKPTRRDLAVALDELLAGKPISVAKTKVDGCLIARATTPKADGAVTYTRDVAAIVQNRCQACHRPGQVGPMPLMGYDDAVAWSAMIREVVSDGRMPPWHADPKYGKFSNDRRLTDAEKKTLLAWIDGGLARGDAKDAPPAKEWVDGWRIGKPDVVFEMPREFTVPAAMPKNGVAYQYFTVKTDFAEDKWVTLAEARPGAAEVVHHILVFIVPPGQLLPIDGAGGNVLCGTAPGDSPLVLPAGTAKRVPAGASLVFQMHYTPNGKEQKDRSKVGIVFAKEPPKFRVQTRPIINPTFLSKLDKIPAGADNYEIVSEFTFRKDGKVVHFMPHMHLRGKDFRFEAHYPDGKKEVLLSVPRFEFGWQSVYRFAEPLAMPKGTKIHCVAHFDNSAKNPNNPDAGKDVFWGDQTWEEMMVGWMDFLYDEPAVP